MQVNKKLENIAHEKIAARILYEPCNTQEFKQEGFVDKLERRLNILNIILMTRLKRKEIRHRATK